MLEHGSSKRPLLLSFDFKAAFPSLKRRWLELTLAHYGVPQGMLWAIAALYHAPIAFARFGDMHLTPMCELASGVLQGCPLSGSLWALCMDPLLRHLQRPFPSLDHGVVRACADDIGLVMMCVTQLVLIAETFCFAEKLAGLALQPAKCVAVPLWAPLSSEVQSQTHSDLVEARGWWGAFQVSDVVKYLGVWLGPGATAELQWKAPIGEVVETHPSS